MALEKILIIDDDVEFAKMCKDQLFSIETVKEVDVIESGVEFFKHFMSKDYSLVILDYMLRDIDGLQILIEMKEKGFKLPVVIITGQGDESVVVDCYRQGAIDYIIKDYDNIQNLKNRILEDYDKYHDQFQKDKTLDELKEKNEKLFKQIKDAQQNEAAIKKDSVVLKTELKASKEKINRDRTIYESIVFALSYALDRNREDAEIHASSLLSKALTIGRELNISEDELENLRITSYLIDIGATGIDQSDLVVDQELNEEQQNRVKKICEGGADIINTQKRLNHIAMNVLYQFERWDGKGYPYGLQKDEIPMVTRIIQVPKVYDILTRFGYQKSKFSHEDAINFINQRAGTFYDPNVTFAFIKTIKSTK